MVAFGVAAAAGLGVDVRGGGGLMFGGGGGAVVGLVDRRRGGVGERNLALPGGVAGRAEDAGVRAGVGRREERVLLRRRVHGGRD